MKRHVPKWAYLIKKELCKLSQIYYKASKKLQGWQKHCFEVWGSWRTTSPTRRWSTPPPSTSASSLQGQLIVNQERKKVFCYFFQKLFFLLQTLLFKPVTFCTIFCYMPYTYIWYMYICICIFHRNWIVLKKSVWHTQRNYFSSKSMLFSTISSSIVNNMHKQK